ncbi:class I SAM-dependent methyltransferase [Fodinibius sp.]|uniref:class I SAM-dependent methyltransferase n=1 Tax=Fodinibius sp. TaxID=1872440 RepID=UPI002ACE8920|nr:class I SAM-dependent methyltransferase [Fodinibius sp.]MDZ7660576.1 class I SAM-dependent methyltransferase [Fodinibius sp.]
MKKLTQGKSLLNYFFVVLLFLGFSIASASPISAQDLDVPYVPTPDNVVERMLDITDVESSDYVIDLGSGDGRIVIAAAKRGASGHGIDLDPKRIAEARENARNEGVDDQIMFMKGDIFDTDFSEASVITMYLLPSVNKKLRPELIEKLQPGTRVVSHSFDMGSWKADKKVVVINDGRSHDIYYWVIPAQTEGTWSWSYNGTDFNMTVNQRFQEISVKLTDNNNTFFDIHKAELKGKRLTVRASNGDQNYIFSGRVEGDKIYGMMQHHNGQKKNFSQWSATKK